MKNPTAKFVPMFCVVFMVIVGFVCSLCLPVTARAANNVGEMKVAQATTKSNKKSVPQGKTTTTSANYDGWVVTCVTSGTVKKEICSAIFKLANKEKKAILMTWLIGFNNKNVMMSEIVTPTDVMIAPGLEIIADDKKPVKVLYTACGTRGCKSSFPMTKKLRASLAKAKKVSLKFIRIDGRTVSINLEFQGFGKAHAELSK